MTGVLAGNAGAFLGSLLFGGAVVATRVAVRDVPPLSLAVLRYGQGAAILLLVLAAGARGSLRVERRDVPLLAILGVILFAVFPVSFNATLELTTASRGAVMLASMPLWSAVMARAMGREDLAPRQLGALLLSVAGVAAVFAEGGVLSGGASSVAGNGLMLFGAFCGAVYGVLVKPLLGRYPALTMTAYTMAAGALLLLPIALAEDLAGTVAGIDGQAAVLILYLGVLGGALGFYLISFALARLTPTQAAVYINLKQ